MSGSKMTKGAMSVVAAEAFFAEMLISIKTWDTMPGRALIGLEHTCGTHIDALKKVRTSNTELQSNVKRSLQRMRLIRDSMQGDIKAAYLREDKAS